MKGYLWGSLLVCACGILLLLDSPVQAQTKSYEEIYQQVFKKPFVKDLQTYQVNLIANGKFLGRISLQAPATGPVEKVGQTPFMDLIRDSLNVAAYEELVRLVDDQGFIPERDLVVRGYKLTLYRSKGYIVMTVPRDKRTEFVYVDLQGGAWLPQSALTPPRNTVSGYVNMWASVSQAETNNAHTDSPTSVDLESVINVHGVALRQVGNLSTEGKTPYALSRVQGVYDTPDFTRYIVGDVDFPVRGFQGMPRVFGVGVGKLYYRNRQLMDRDNQSVSVKIPKDGTMRLRLNGRDLRQMPVEQGTYVFQNIPVGIGANRLEIDLTYADGSTETRTEILIRDTDIVGVGQSEFYYAAGVYSEDTARDYRVKGDRPVASVYHVYRPHAFWVQGVYGQIDQDQQLLGLDTYFPTIWGVFRLDTARYQARDQAFGGLLEYKTYYDPGGFVGSSRVVLAGYGSGFRKFGDSADTDIEASFSGDTNLNVAKDTFVTLRAFAEQYRSRTGTYYGAGATLAQQWDWLRMSWGGSYSRSTSGLEDYAVFSDAYLKLTSEWMSTVQTRWQNRSSVSDVTLSLYLTWSPGAGVPGGGSHAFTGGYQSSDSSQQLGYTYGDAAGTFGNMNTRFVGGGLQQTTLGFGQRSSYSDLQVNGSFSDFAQTNDMNHTLRYSNTRGLLDVTYTESRSKTSDSFARRTAYRLETALAFADGQIAFGRPIRDNFVLVYPQKDLAGRAFTVEGNGLVDMFGPAVLTDLPAWSQTNVSIGDIPDVPEGYDLGPLRHNVSLGYYGGQAIQVGQGMRTRVFGAVRTERRSLAYVAADVFDVKSPDQTLRRILTGAEGRFLIQGLAPGSYGLRFRAFSDDVIYFDIDNVTDVRSYDMGSVVLKDNAPEQ